MSLISTAVIAGASAALTRAADDTVKFLYDRLKGGILEFAGFPFEEIEKDPTSGDSIEKAKRTVANENLDEHESLRSTARHLIERLDEIEAELPTRIMIEIEELQTDGDITLRNINLSRGSLLKAKKIKSKGSFIAENIKIRERSTEGTGAQISIGSATARTINIGALNAIKRFVDLPTFAQLSIIGAFLILVVILAIPIFGGLAADSEKAGNLKDVYNRQIADAGDQLSRAVRILQTESDGRFENTTPGNLRSAGRRWKQSTETADAFLRPIASCLNAGTCELGSLNFEICNIAEITSNSRSKFIRKFEGTGVNLDFTGSAAEGDSFGPNIVVPRSRAAGKISQSYC